MGVKFLGGSPWHTSDLSAASVPISPLSNPVPSPRSCATGSAGTQVPRFSSYCATSSCRPHTNHSPNHKASESQGSLRKGRGDSWLCGRNSYGWGSSHQRPVGLSTAEFVIPSPTRNILLEITETPKVTGAVFAISPDSPEGDKSLPGMLVLPHS